MPAALHRSTCGGAPPARSVHLPVRFHSQANKPNPVLLLLLAAFSAVFSAPPATPIPLRLFCCVTSAFKAASQRPDTHFAIIQRAFRPQSKPHPALFVLLVAIAAVKRPASTSNWDLSPISAASPLYYRPSGINFAAQPPARPLPLSVRFRSKTNTRHPLFLCFIPSNDPNHSNCRV